MGYGLGFRVQGVGGCLGLMVKGKGLESKGEGSGFML